MTNDTTQVQLVVFTVDAGEYALPITEVQEVIRYTAPRGVGEGGVINVRGKLIPVTDLASRLGGVAAAAEHSDENAKIVIVDTGSGRLGLVVDSVDEVTTVARGEIEPAPVGDATLIDGIAKLGDRLVLVLAARGLAVADSAAPIAA